MYEHKYMKQINIQYTLENKRANASVEKLILSKVRWRVYMGVPCIIFTVWCGLKLIRIKSTVRDMRLNLKKKNDHQIAKWGDDTTREMLEV